MTINVESVNAMASNNIYLPNIKLVGVGGGGGNVVNRMIKENIKGVQYLSANTDLMVLESSKAENKIQLGKKLTNGMGAGMRPDVGHQSAIENIEEISEYLEGTDMVFIAAGMGGGTGTGAAPVFAEIAKNKGILTIGVVTLPFGFEGSKRNKIALQGVQELEKKVDSLIVVSNNRLLELASKKTSMNEAFDLVDDVLKQAIGGITNLINLEGVINLDFADVQTVMRDKGSAFMGTGVGVGENRGEAAVKSAIASPLLNHPIDGADGIIINIIADESFTMLDATATADYVRKKANSDADIIFGLVTDPSKKEEVHVTVIATGFH